VTIVEFPKNSGRAADYSEAELSLVRALMAEAEQRGVERSQLAHELVVLHEVKVCLDARLCPDEERVAIFDEAPASSYDPDAHFQMPMSAR